MSRSVQRRCSVIALCLAFALALSVQAMLGVAMAAPAHAAGMASSMPDGCKGCDGAKADGGCALVLCANAVGVLVDAPRVEPQSAASPTPAADFGAAGLATDPDPLPPRR